jgi:hypothetical protein
MGEDHKLDLMLAYSTFHIGLYVSLAAAFIAGSEFLREYRKWLGWGVLCLVVAGAFGGLIASNIAEDPVSSAALIAGSTKLELLWPGRIITFSTAAHAEHVAFWIGMLPITCIFVYRNFVKEICAPRKGRGGACDERSKQAEPTGERLPPATLPESSTLADEAHRRLRS